MKKESVSKQSEATKKFIESNWNKALAVAGAAGVIGAGIWLTARYLREQRQKNKLDDQALKMIEEDVEMSNSEPAALLETGMYLNSVAGDEGRKALLELAGQMDDTEAKEALEIIKQTMDISRMSRGKI